MDNNSVLSFPGTRGKKILFCGDDDIDLAARYLAAILNAEGYDLDYVPSALAFPDAIQIRAYSLIIFSDYPRARIPDHRMEQISDHVLTGGSFLMIGGWESFRGEKGEYRHSPLEKILPVCLENSDDRHNHDQGIIVLPGSRGHGRLEDMDWKHPAIIGGYNSFLPKPGAGVCLTGYELGIIAGEGTIRTGVDDTPIPLLVSANTGEGKSAALAFDLAPHWVGGFIDWGNERKRIDFNRGCIEVGNYYYEFVRNLIDGMFR